MAKAKAPTLVTASISKLVLDYNIYPRHEVDSQHANRIRHAIEAGEAIPPIVAQRGTMRVVDGFHRVTAYGRIDGPDAQVQVELRDYASDAELFLDAVCFNTGRGRDLTSYDQSRCIAIFDQLQVEPEAQAKALKMTVQRMADLQLRKTAIAAGSTLQTVPIKATVRHLAGKHLTVVQEEAAERTGGMRPLFYINQVINLVQGDLIDWEDSNLVEALARLHDVLGAQPQLQGAFAQVAS